MQPPENTAGSLPQRSKSSSSECFRNVSPIRSSCPFQSLCANRHAASTKAAMITIHRYEKGTQFYPFQCHRNCKYLKKPQNTEDIPRPVPWLLPPSFSVSVSADFLHRKIPAAPGSVRQLPVSAPAFHTFSPASLARIPIATFSGVIGSSLTRTPVAL